MAGTAQIAEAPALLPDDATTGAVIREVLEKFPDNYGELKSLGMPVDRPGAVRWQTEFIRDRLPEYGPFEFALESDSTTLYHSMASVLLNAGLLSPQECVAMAVSAYDEGEAPINSAEGYVKQVMEWGESTSPAYTGQRHARYPGTTTSITTAVSHCCSKTSR
jgi:deoxyribodipyrimidine photolyase-related protein